MSYEKVKQAEDVLIGTKQTLKALESNIALEIILAEDADPAIKSRILQHAESKEVSVQIVESMKQLGKACGIDVGAAVVTLKK
ncbi:LSU ribosomal protein L7AE [Sinobaca qinghaiensis]|uniref:LSU ribosomal protein L7AE n=1 Tax=Sinobaca qinghaiensis TaxID=342944 RepID=A0A419UTT4_9BACL|nr:50S ribosomal protein L7ae-like protein [Sinobaca qinghaiensis]RKD67553.1 LSU ribosomal protein L7AE [Sinobaca qinghaiensis]